MKLKNILTNDQFVQMKHFGFPLQEKFPAVERLPVHLQNGQTVIFHEGQERHKVDEGPPSTKLTAYFERVKYERLQPLSNLERGIFPNTNIINPTPLDIPHSEFVSYHTWIR